MCARKALEYKDILIKGGVRIGAVDFYSIFFNYCVLRNNQSGIIANVNDNNFHSGACRGDRGVSIIVHGNLKFASRNYGLLG